ncbi:MAG: hypothetical protein Kow00109_19860 [Acidobacteriota bacterium]
MSRKRLVVIGGVAAGASAAARARRMNEEIEIVVLEAGPYISYANCGLPYYVGGEIRERNRLLVADRDVFSRRFNLDVRVETKVVAIEPAARRVRAVDAGGAESVISYDRLVLATGAVPIRLPVPGLDHPAIFQVRTVPDVDAIKERLTAARARSGREELEALVVGGGYIGLEMAEQLSRQGCRVTVVEMLPQVMRALDFEMAELLHQTLVSNGVRVFTAEGLAAVRQSGDGLEAETTAGRRIPFQLGILAAGVKPNAELARAAGLRLGAAGGVAVDEFQRTSDENIYAAGDVAEVWHRVAERRVFLPLAGPANKTGRIAGNNAALDLLGAPPDDPRRLSFGGVLGTAVVRVFDTYAAVTGLTERSARECGRECEVTYLWGGSHAGYYPGAEGILFKLVFEPSSGRLLGAQAVGGEGTEKRIDVLAAAIQGELTVEDLAELDLCYAPPVGSAKDLPVMAGFLAQNQVRGVMPAWSPVRFLQVLRERSGEVFVLDVRSELEYAAGHVPGAVNIPVDHLRRRRDELPAGKPIAVYCQGGYRSYAAQRILLQYGFAPVYNVLGGYRLIQWCARALERRSAAEAVRQAGSET